MKELGSGHSRICKTNGVAGGVKWGTGPGAQALGALQHTLFTHLRTRF